MEEKRGKPLEIPPVDQRLKAEIHSLTLTAIEEIGAAQLQRLALAGIKSVQGLFKRGSTPKGRREIAAESGIAEDRILKWVSLADLLRVPGVGPEYASLLEAAGVDTLVELAHRNPENLHQQIIKINQAKNLMRRPPGQKQVQDWIKAAKKLPKLVQY